MSVSMALLGNLPFNDLKELRCFDVSICKRTADVRQKRSKELAGVLQANCYHDFRKRTNNSNPNFKKSNKSAKLSKHQQKINTNDRSITRSALNQNYCTIRSPCGYYATGGFWRFDQWHTTQQANKAPKQIV